MRSTDNTTNNTTNTTLAAFLALVLLAGCGPAPEAPEASGTDAAPTVVAFLDGGTASLESLRGQWVFVNYWAEWCAPCLEEIPELNELHADVDGARVIGINYDRLEADVMRPQVASLGIAFPVAVDDAGAVFGIEAPQVLPSTFVFAPDGSARGILRGPQTLENLRAAMGAGEVSAGGR